MTQDRARELLRAGEPAQALAALQDLVRGDPSNAEKRVFLFQLLSVLGQWERAARQLFCHRHTLRYRIRKIEELTDRDLERATDRIEFYLALRARGLLP